MRKSAQPCTSLLIRLGLDRHNQVAGVARGASLLRRPFTLECWSRHRLTVAAGAATDFAGGAIATGTVKGNLTQEELCEVVVLQDTRFSKEVCIFAADESDVLNALQDQLPAFKCVCFPMSSAIFRCYMGTWGGSCDP